MDLITSFHEYKRIISDNRDNFRKIKSNCFLLADDIRHLIDGERLFYEKFDCGIIIYVDEIRYYTAYYFINNESAFPNIQKKNKEVCIEEIDVNHRRETDIKIMNTILMERGIIAKRYNYEFILDLDNRFSDELRIQFEKDLASLKKQGLTMVFCQKEHADQVLKLWQNSLTPTDIPYDHLNFVMNKQNRVLCIVNDANEVCCVEWWNDDKGVREGRHLVTHPLYYRKGLGSSMIRAWLADAIDCGMKKARTWIETDNTTSLNIHNKVGFIKSGKICMQYIL